MLSDLRTAARRAAEQRRARDRAHDDLELIDGLLAKAEALKSDVAAAAPYLNTGGAREHVAAFADLLDDCLGDSLSAARAAADRALDDASPLARPARAA
jgi:hypothetical protein